MNTDLHDDSEHSQVLALPAITPSGELLGARSPHETIARQHESFVGNALLVSLLDAIPDLVLILNRNRQIVFANEAVMAFAGLNEREDLCGPRPGELLGCQEAGRAHLGCGTGEVCKTCGAVRAILKAQGGQRACEECRILRAEGLPGADALDLKVWTTPFAWADDAFTLIVASDISDIKRRHVLERTFFHDVLNTAGSLWGLAQLLQSGDISFDEVKDDLAMTSEALVNEIHTHRMLLAAESGQLPTVPVSLESSRVIAEVLATARGLEEAKGRNILRDEVEAIGFASDETLLRRVLTNLLKNALEATPVGGTVTLGSRKVTSSSGAPAIEFFVHNPTVMSPAVKLQVFQRSFSTKGIGRGIGTYSVKLLTEKYLGGRVGFTSEERTGTRFHIELPVE
jgi:PAS domain-containing protein